MCALQVEQSGREKSISVQAYVPAPRFSLEYTREAFAMKTLASVGALIPLVCSLYCMYHVMRGLWEGRKIGAKLHLEPYTSYVLICSLFFLFLLVYFLGGFFYVIRGTRHNYRFCYHQGSLNLSKSFIETYSKTRLFWLQWMMIARINNRRKPVEEKLSTKNLHLSVHRHKTPEVTKVGVWTFLFQNKGEALSWEMYLPEELAEQVQTVLQEWLVAERGTGGLS